MVVINSETRSDCSEEDGDLLWEFPCTTDGTDGSETELGGAGT